MRKSGLVDPELRALPWAASSASSSTPPSGLLVMLACVLAVCITLSVADSYFLDESMSRPPVRAELYVEAPDLAVDLA